MVSIIVPNYNHDQFLLKRLNSIFNQTFQDFELILLDDFSRDGSWEYLSQFTCHPKVSHCIRNESNSGSPFTQWKKGLDLAKGDLIWIAESDDFAEYSFLERCMPFFQSKEVSMVIASSFNVDSFDQPIREVSLDFSPGFHIGNFFVSRYMYFQNSVVNASSVVFRKAFIDEEILDQLGEFQLCGDHLFWAGLMKDHSIVFLEDRLNFFRWHEKSVRYKELKKLTELKEGIRVKKWIENQVEILKIDKSKSRRDAYLAYFKYLKQNRVVKNWNEFLQISSFFEPLDRLKAFIRFFILS